jgi:hypothetical protein
MSKTKKKALQNRIHALAVMLMDRDSQIADLHSQIEKLKQRLRVIGTEVPTLDEDTGPVKIIRAHTSIYGMYSYVKNEALEDPAIFENVKQRLIGEIVNALMDTDTVQFITHDAPGLLEMSTIGAKLYVVPWEEVRLHGYGIEIGVTDGDEKA